MTKSLTKEIVKQIGKDISRTKAFTSLENLATETVVVASKSPYLLLGNLSYNIQNKLENLVGKQYYDAEEAYKCSCVSNIYGGFLAGFGGCCAILIKDAPAKPTAGDSLVALVSPFILGGISASLSFYEMEKRNKIAKHNEEKYGLKVSASLLGKIISIPIDSAIYVGDKVIDYTKDVYKRAQNNISEK